MILAVAAIALAAALLMRSQKAPPNVLFITIDTLRADAPNEEDTPALMELAKRGTRFMSARTPVPLTLPAHASALTGFDPREHGLRTNTAPALTARSIAEATGGFLGLGNKVSSEEEVILAELAKAFET